MRGQRYLVEFAHFTQSALGLATEIAQRGRVGLGDQLWLA